MKVIRSKSMIPVATLFAFLLTVDGLIAEEANASRPTVPPAAKAEAAGVPETIPWRTLAPDNGRPFNDPFSRLTRDQLAELSYVVRVRRLIAEEKIDVGGADAKEAVKLSRKLKQQGVDIGWLMVQRERVRQIRGLQIEAVAQSVAKSLTSNIVTINGYATPVREQAGLAVEFLVTPTTAMCSHSTAPSPLQVVSVKAEQGYALRSKGTLVRVTGVLIAESKSTPLMTASGVQSFPSAYKIVPSKIAIAETFQR